MTLEKKFRRIAAAEAGQSLGSCQYDACPDQCVGSIPDFDATAADFPVRRPVTQRGDYPCTLLIIESPHQKEFVGVVGPAKGSTGRLIRHYVGAIITRLGGPLSELILVNAIQYQCSLGVETCRFRDKVFRCLWSEGARRDFVERLSALRQPGDMLLNCCTGSDPETGLRQLVKGGIRDVVGSDQIYGGPHPSSWASPDNRKFVGPVEAE